ncbi:hypothetical protein A3860_05360 [Niastella vici]|uniref:Outer membrane protein beta-barrel domain-containing protein n=1 Tax=Niastella vici TaxID=1703345 RepID=A0A1V9FS83_9BACT|nr:outer membrane beta-barrel family protein [Niastella vici]OQP61147.1 hypothetical protein A3860_05360 [Niastella vici]
MKYSLGLFLLMITVICPGLMAQQNPAGRPVVVQGKVVGDEQVSFATVALLRARDGGQVTRTVTDSLGRFNLTVNTGDTFLLAVSHVGFISERSPVFNPDTAKEDVLHFTIRLNRNAAGLKEVEVTKMPVVERKLDRVVIRVDNNIVASGESVMELLRTLPGIVVDGANNVSIKGRSDIRVMIDGRETYLKGEQLKAMLASMPANNIQKVEVFSNPPARYSAEGAGGLINLITKNRETPGISGNIYSSYAQGIYGRTTAGGLLNYKNKRLLVTGSYDLVHGTGFFNDDEKRRFLSSSPVITFLQQTHRPTTSTNHYYKAGFDYRIARNQNIAVSFDGTVSDSRKPYDATLKVYHDPNAIDSSYTINNLTKTHYTNTNLNADYTLRIDTTGQTLTANYSHLQFNTKDTNSYHSLFFDNNGSNPRAPQMDGSYNKATIRVNAYKLDYKRNLPGKVQLETGLKYTSSVTDNDIAFYIFQNGAYKKDVSRTNHFIYTENIGAAYISARRNFKKLDIQAGLRYEETRAKIDLITDTFLIRRHLQNLFPTLFLEYRISDNHKLNFTSGRRIKRPDYASLNPFAFYYDPFSYSTGNPYLLPQFTFSNDVTYTYRNENTLSLGYSYVTNLLNEITIQNDTTKTVIYKNENINSSKSLYLEVYVPWKIASWWSTNADVNVAYTSVKGNADYGVFSNKRTEVSVSNNHNFTLPKGYTAQVNFLYYGPSVYGVTVFKGRERLSLGLKRSFFKKSLTATLRFTDIFYSDKVRTTTTVLNQDIAFRTVRDTRKVGITLTYNFRSGAKFNERKVQFGGQDEKNRMSITPKTN